MPQNFQIFFVFFSFTDKILKKLNLFFEKKIPFFYLKENVIDVQWWMFIMEWMIWLNRLIDIRIHNWTMNVISEGFYFNYLENVSDVCSWGSNEDILKKIINK